MTAAAEDQLEIFGKLLHEKLDTRCIGMIGAAEHFDKEMEVLHRSVRVIKSELMEIEADQKHVHQLLEDLGLIQSNIVRTPRVKLRHSRQKQWRKVEFLKESKRQCFGAEACDVRICAERSTFAQTQFNSSKRDWTP